MGFVFWERTARRSRDALPRRRVLPISDIRRPSASADLRKLARLERFARGLARAFPWPAAMVRALPDDAVVCRCENVSAAAVRESAELGSGEANRVKSLSRVGMGRCQGRYCQLAAVELVAAQVGCAPGAVGRFRGQAPVRPAPVGAFLRKG